MAAGKALPILVLGAVAVGVVAMSKKSSAASSPPAPGQLPAQSHPMPQPMPAPHPSTQPAPPIVGPVFPFPNVPSTPSAGPAGPSFSSPYDAGMPTDLAKAVTTALALETDPGKLRAFAASLRPDYPIAATALEGKATALEAAAAAMNGTMPTLPPSPIQLPGGGVVGPVVDMSQPSYPSAQVVTGDPNGTLNVRSEPNLGGGLVGQLLNGNVVSIIGPEVNGFTPVQTPAGTIQGYVSTQYLRPVGGGGAPAPDGYQNTAYSDFPAPGSSGVVATQGGDLNVRDAPNVGGGLVATLPNGSAITVIGPGVNGFLPVSTPAGTVQGYASAQYLAPAPGQGGYTAGAGSSYGAIPPGHKAVIQSGRGRLVLRSAPNASAPPVSTLSHGVAVLVDGPEVAGYVPVRYAGGRAFASARYLVPAPSTASTAGVIGGPVDKLHDVARRLNASLHRGTCSSGNEPLVREFQIAARGAGIYPGAITGFYDTVTQAALATLVGAPAPPCFRERGGPINPNTYWQPPRAA